MVIFSDYSLLQHNSLRLDLNAEFFALCKNLADCRQAIAFAGNRHLPVTILGGGTNVLLTGHLPGLVIHFCGRGRRLALEGRHLRLEVAAGENWADVCNQVSQAGWWGLERLAAIPGLAGAASVQNIGAYGAELSEVCESVSTLDMRTGETHCWPAAACRFGYRHSVFKETAGHHLILSLQMKLGREAREISHLRLLDELGSSHDPCPAEVHDAVVGVRRRLLPDPETQPNIGSFFKNPVISVAEFGRLKRLLDIEGFRDGGKVKVAAAQLIDACRLKGTRIGGAEVSSRHALVLQNAGSATPDDMLKLARLVQQRVGERFGVNLDPEASLLGGRFL